MANFPTCGEGSRLGGTVGETTAKPGGLPRAPWGRLVARGSQINANDNYGLFTIWLVLGELARSSHRNESAKKKHV